MRETGTGCAAPPAGGAKERGSGTGFLMAGDSQPSRHSLLIILSRLPSKSRAHWLRAQVATVTARPMAAPPPSPLLPGRCRAGAAGSSSGRSARSLLRPRQQHLRCRRFKRHPVSAPCAAARTLTRFPQFYLPGALNNGNAALARFS